MIEDPSETENLIFETIDDMISNFLYYDRKGDSELGVGKIQEALASGVITIDDMVSRFRESLEGGLKS